MIYAVFISFLFFGAVVCEPNEKVEAIRDLVQEKINETAPDFEACDENLMKKAKFGDLIEIERSSYYHWAVFIKNATVIQLNNPDFDNLNVHNVFENFTGHVELRDLKELAGNDSCRINNKQSEAARKNLNVLSNEVMLQRMKEELNHNVTFYNVITYNCEHFAVKMRFGVSFSSQIEAVKEIANNVKEKLGEIVAKMFKTAKEMLGNITQSRTPQMNISSVEV